MTTEHRGPVRRALASAGLKRAFDMVIGALLLAVSLPVQVPIAVAVRLDSPGPVFYRARRCGQGTSMITVYKFRTMRVDADVVGPAVSSANDPRITRLGRLLRSSRLDELPQLWNVVRGDMSLVGPRPEDPRFVALYSPIQRIALSVRPGITGRAQLAFHDEARLLATTDPDATYVRDILPHKVDIDIAYALNHNLLMDLRILLETVRTVLLRRGGRS